MSWLCYRFRSQLEKSLLEAEKAHRNGCLPAAAFSYRKCTEADAAHTISLGDCRVLVPFDGGELGGELNGELDSGDMFSFLSCNYDI